MKILNGKYVLSKTDKKKAISHTRAVARSYRGQYDGKIECWFNSATGAFRYIELVGTDYSFSDSPNMEYICSADVKS